MVPPTIKVQPKTGVVPARKQQDRPSQQPKEGKGLIRRIMEIVINDIKHPLRIFEKERKVVVPESKESWKDWEGQV
jgi:hypothetical protein